MVLEVIRFPSPITSPYFLTSSSFLLVYKRPRLKHSLEIVLQRLYSKSILIISTPATVFTACIRKTFPHLPNTIPLCCRNVYGLKKQWERSCPHLVAKRKHNLFIEWVKKKTNCCHTPKVQWTVLLTGTRMMSCFRKLTCIIEKEVLLLKEKKSLHTILNTYLVCCTQKLQHRE